MAKDKKSKDEKEKQSKRFFKILSYALFFYFGIRLIIVPVLFSRSPAVIGGVAGLVLNIVLLLVGLYATYNLLKFKKWALIVISSLLAIQIVSESLMSVSLGELKIPFVKVAVLVLLLSGFKHLKNVK